VLFFQWSLRTSEKRDSTPAAFLFRMSTIRVIHRVTSVLPSRDSILSPKAQSASPNVLCCRASTSFSSSPQGEFRLLSLSLSPPPLSFSLSLSLSVLLTFSSLCRRSLKGTSLFFRVLFVFRRTKLFPPSPLLSNPNRLVTVYHWQTPKLIAGESRCDRRRRLDGKRNFRFIYLRDGDCATFVDVSSNRDILRIEMSCFDRKKLLSSLRRYRFRDMLVRILLGCTSNTGDSTA